MAGGTFAFEGAGDDLTLLPLAARRALDVAGVKLSLAAWQGLPLERREALVVLGGADRIPAAAVRALLVDASPTPGVIPPLDEADLVRCDATAVALLGPGRPLELAWGALPPLARFALRHLARRGDPARIAAAYDELVGAPRLAHLDASGEAHMVDVGEKPVTLRRAVARARVCMLPATARLLEEGSLPKGDALATARLAGIMAAKRTSDLVPLCHPIGLTRVTVDLRVEADEGRVVVVAATETRDRTGVEMEAMVAASAAALTLYDMLKGVERGIRIEDVVLLEKLGGRSGHYRREGEP